MSVKAIMEGTHAGSYGVPLPDKEAATIVSKTAKAVDKRHGTDVKSKESQEGRSLSCTLHQYRIVWNNNPRLPWADRVEGLLEEAGEQITSYEYSAARATLSKIRVQMFRK